jgi:hypothetical protein
MAEEKKPELEPDYRPVLDKVCPVCGAKHWERGSLCYFCTRFDRRD